MTFRPITLTALILLATAAAVAPASAAPANSRIDLSVPASPGPRTDAFVFDESVIFAPNFAVNQRDPALADLFGAKGVSNLCFPTALAESLIQLFGYHAPPFGDLRLEGLAPDRGSIEPNALVRQLAAACKTDANGGTDSRDAIACVTALLAQSGYGVGRTRLISPFNREPSLPVESREVKIQDIRDSLKAGFPILLEAAWFVIDPATKTWTRHSGHYVSVFGYDYDRSWGEDQIQLKIINPESDYGSVRDAALWDTVTVLRVSPQPGVTYPPHRPFILAGPGFGGAKQRGFLGMMLTIAPATH